MNFKYHATKLEGFLTENFRKELPIAVIDKNTLIYKNFKIKRLKSGDWGLFQKGGFMIEKFDLRVCALMAAKAYSANRLSEYLEIINLDKYYQVNFRDSEIFSYRMRKCKDSFDKDIALWRWEITNARAEYAKAQITHKFKCIF